MRCTRFGARLGRPKYLDGKFFQRISLDQLRCRHRSCKPQVAVLGRECAAAQQIVAPKQLLQAINLSWALIPNNPVETNNDRLCVPKTLSKLLT